MCHCICQTDFKTSAFESLLQCFGWKKTVIYSGLDGKPHSLSVSDGKKKSVHHVVSVGKLWCAFVFLSAPFIDVRKADWMCYYHHSGGRQTTTRNCVGWKKLWWTHLALHAARRYEWTHTACLPSFATTSKSRETTSVGPTMIVKGCRNILASLIKSHIGETAKRPIRPRTWKVVYCSVIWSIRPRAARWEFTGQYTAVLRMKREWCIGVPADYRLSRCEIKSTCEYTACSLLLNEFFSLWIRLAVRHACVNWVRNWTLPSPSVDAAIQWLHAHEH